MKRKSGMNWKSGHAFVSIPFFILILLVACIPVIAQENRVVALGADLTDQQRTMMASEFGINLVEANVPVVEITNQEERKYLEGLAPDNVVGSRAISSALVEVLPAGQGIKVQARNITWVTVDMYANALATAGVKDANISVSAPFPVSGTAALTGIFKGFEIATGRSLGNNNKRIANEELVETGKLGQEIGRDKAARLMFLAKERIAAENIEDHVRIKQIIIEVAGDLNITLHNRQLVDITALMQKISGLNLQAGDLTNQLAGMRGEVERAMSKQPQLKSFLQRILDALNQFIEQVRTLILGQEQAQA